MRPKLVEEWDYEKNTDFSPTDVTIGTHKKVWWKCSECGCEWQASISNRSKGRGGIYKNQVKQNKKNFIV